MAEIFLERHYTNAAPQRSLLNQGRQLWQGWRTTFSTARAYTDSKPEASTGLGALNDADPLNKNNAGIGLVVPIEDTAHLMR